MFYLIFLFEVYFVGIILQLPMVCFFLKSIGKNDLHKYPTGTEGNKIIVMRLEMNNNLYYNY